MLDFSVKAGLTLARQTRRVISDVKRDTNDLLSCSHSVLQSLAAGSGAGRVPHSDAAGQDAASKCTLSHSRTCIVFLTIKRT